MSPPWLTTPRLRMRPIAPDDAPALHALWTHPDVRRFLWDDVVVGAEVVADVISASGRTFASDGWGFWVVLPLEVEVEGARGFCGFRHEPDTGEVELIYGLEPALWGRGLATEAAEASLAYVFDRVGLPEVVAGTDAPNGASIRVLEKMGMRLLRCFSRPDLPHEQLRFALDAETFRARATR